MTINKASQSLYYKFKKIPALKIYLFNASHSVVLDSTMG